MPSGGFSSIRDTFQGAYVGYTGTYRVYGFPNRGTFLSGDSKGGIKVGGIKAP